uniref:Uncharacterized protein n=1 Tax=Theileria annulata TaxID=5874 RepID=A0A3B0MRW6_THEAN
MLSSTINNVNGLKKCYHIIIRRNLGYLTISPRFISQLVTSSKLPQININNSGLVKDSNDFTNSSFEPSSPSEVVKCYQLLRSKLKGYDDLEFLERLSRKTLSNLTKLTPEELVNITEILSSLKYRNVLLMHAITESLYWMCKLRKVKLQHITKFLKFSILLKYIPNVRYLDVFFKEIDDNKHKKTVGDYLRLLQFLVESDLWVYERYIKLYLKLYEHCVNNLGLMPHCNLSSFSQIQTIIDNSNTELFERICMNFEREVEKSEVKHLRMLCNSLLKSNINQLPLAFNRVMKYYLNCRKNDFIPNLSIETLNLYVKFYYRDTEILNKLGNIVAESLSNYTPSQLAILLNGFSTFSYKHKELIKAITQYISGLEIGDPTVNLRLISSLSNLISKTKFHHITSINYINHISTLLTTNSSDCIHSSGRADSVVTVDSDSVGMGFKRIITSDIIKLNQVPVQNSVNSTKPHKLMNKAKSSQVKGRLRYVPESTDIIKVQTLSECLAQFYEKFFNGVHPANERLIRRKLMLHHLKTHSSSGIGSIGGISSNKFEVNKSLSKVYNEKRYDNNYNTSIKRVKYKMRYSGSRYVQPTTYYINEIKILKRLFLAQFTRKLPSSLNHRYMLMDNGSNNHKSITSNRLRLVNGIIGSENDKYYVDTGINNIQWNKLRYKTKCKVWKELSLFKPVKGVIDYLIENNKWILDEKSTAVGVEKVQKSELEHIIAIISSLSRINCVSFPLTNSLLQNFTKFVKICNDSETYSLRFLNSFNILLTSVKPIISTDRSSTILNSIMLFLKSGEFEGIIDEYLRSKTVEKHTLNKLLHNLSFITLYKNMDHFKSVNELKMNNSEGILNIMCKIIKAYHSVDTLDTNTVDNVDWLNNLSYTLWLINNEENINSGKMFEEVGKIMDNEVNKIIEQLKIKNCETSLIKYYLSIIDNYQRSLNNNNSVNTSVSVKNIDVKNSLKELMEKYKMNKKMISNFVVDELKLKNNLASFQKIMEINKINPNTRHGDTQLYNFYYYYYAASSPGLISPLSDSVNHANGFRKSFSDLRLAKITHRGKEAPIRFVFHEILRILSKHKRSLHTLELEKALRNIGFEGVNISTNKELFDLLNNNKLIEFNIATKRLLYKNRFESIVSQETLLSFVVSNTYKGLRVNLELLSSSPSMVIWVNDLLKYRKVRVLRSNSSNTKGKKRCRFAGSQNQCGVYSSSKCQECYSNVEGLILFPLGKDQFEHDRFKLDHDIKNLWDSVAIPSMDQLLRDYNISQTVITFQPVQTEKKKRKEAKGYESKCLICLDIRLKCVKYTTRISLVLRNSEKELTFNNFNFNTYIIVNYILNILTLYLTYIVLNRKLKCVKMTMLNRIRNKKS